MTKSDGAFHLEYGGRDALADWAPAVNGKVDISFNAKGVEVAVDRDNYPFFEVIQYAPGARPRFLAQQMDAGSPGFMVPPAINSRERWINGLPD